LSYHVNPVCQIGRGDNMRAHDHYVLGLYIGIATLGWALLDQTETAVRAAGVWTFDAPETPKEGVPKTAVRRLHRGQRRVISRRRQRMNAVRALFAEAGLLPNAAPGALKMPGLDPWRLRVEGLDRRLAGEELAVALGHIARHRGFRSNAKREAQANAVAETSKMKKAISQAQERLAQYRTVGEMRGATNGSAAATATATIRGRCCAPTWRRKCARCSPHSAGSVTGRQPRICSSAWPRRLLRSARCATAKTGSGPVRSSRASGGPPGAATLSSAFVCSAG
jgi:hypothetical protein